MADQLGSTMAEVSGAATFLGQYNDDGYGIESDLNGRPSQQTAFLFALKYSYSTDKDSGVVLCGTRSFLPVLGRVLTQDPVGDQGGLNQYGYCDENPLRAVDPRGQLSLLQKICRVLTDYSEELSCRGSAWTAEASFLKL